MAPARDGAFQCGLRCAAAQHHTLAGACEVVVVGFGPVEAVAEAVADVGPAVGRYFLALFFSVVI